jgi:disulfide bond formation protein DsbB
MSNSTIWKYNQVVGSFINAKPSVVITAMAGILTVSAFVLENGFGIRPCPMCWWQRYVHWAITAIGFAYLLPIAARLKRGALGLVGVIAFVGLVIGAWQSGAQWNLLGYPDSCTSAGMRAQFSTEDIMRSLQQQGTIPCDLETFRLLGLSLANWNVLAMSSIIALVLRYFLRSGRHPKA